ncbi:MAG: hypothetical protein AB7O45_00510 [Alphaproteobacteria bacterium]
MTDAPRFAVTVAATYRPLVTLQALHDRLGITAATNDPEMIRLVRARSDAIAAWCGLAADQTGGRTFAVETMTATWLSADCARSTRLLLPWRVPLISITSIVEDGVTLDADDYRTVPMGAMLERIGSDGETPCLWSSAPIVVTYTAGWTAANIDGTDMPADLQDACLQECTTRWRARGRDPGLRSETVPDLHAWVQGYGQDGERNQLLPETEAMLAAGGYRNPAVG